MQINLGQTLFIIRFSGDFSNPNFECGDIKKRKNEQFFYVVEVKVK